MAEITLKYNARSVVAKRALSFLLSLNVFQVKQSDMFDKHMKEAENDLKDGKGRKFETIDEFNQWLYNV